MTFAILNGDNRGSIVFDIEFFQAKMDYDIDLWHSEIQVTTVPNGIIDLIERLVESGKFNKEELKTDCAKVTGLRWWLWEQTECNQNLGTTSDKADERVIGIGNRLKRDVEKVLKSYKSECDALGVSINVCGTVDLIRYTKERKRGYNAVQAERSEINFKELPVNIWL